MSEMIKETPAKKARLGRGLGSLLGGADSVDSQVNSQFNRPLNTQVSSQMTTQVDTQVTTHAEQQKTQQPIVASAVTAENKTEIVKQKEPEQPPILDSQRVWSLDIHKVRPNGSQPRKHFAKAALEELAQSIKEKGILQPITVRKAGSFFEIVAGERRWRAAQAAGLHEVPAIIKDLADQDTLELALIENIQREDLNPIEEARAYQLLADRFHLTQAEIAQKVGKDRTTVTNALRLLGLAAPVQQMVVEGQISMGHARALLAFEDSEDQIKCARLIAQKGLSVRQVEKMAKKQPEEITTEAAKVALASHLIESVQNELQKLLGTKVQIDYTQGRGKLAFHFYSDEEFNSIVDIIRLTWQK